MSEQGKASEMVQPNESTGSEYTLCGGGPGDASLGKAATLPFELTNNEVFRRLLVENQDLRDALEQSNAMLRKRYSEILEFQETQRKEREFIMYKFNEARNLVEKLKQDRSTLQTQLREAREQQEAIKTWKPGEDTEKKQPEDTSVADQRTVPKEPLNEDVSGNLTAAMDNTSPGSSLSSCQTLTPSMCETIRQTVLDYEGPARAKQGETVKRESQIETEAARGAEERFCSQVACCRKVKAEQEWQKKLQEADAQNTQLQQQMATLQGETAELKRQMLEKGAESQRKVLALQQQLEQFTEEKATVKAQVTSLLGELKESQMSLEACLQENRKLEESLRNARELQQDGEAQVKHHMVQLDQCRMQVQNLEKALKMERQKTCEEMRKLAQLQAAYHQLFQEYDTHIKSSLQHEKTGKVQELKQQLQEAEEALVAKQELIDKLKEETEDLRSEIITVPVLKAQAEIYRGDFLAEREAREKLHAEKVRLQEQLEELQREKLRNQSEGTSRALIEEMRNRHLDTRPDLMLPGPYGGAPGSYIHPPHPSFHPVQEFCCPKCQYKAPDMDTLQIHIMDCIK